MKKTALLMMAIIVLTAMLGTTACSGPTAEEKARQDSIRVADSLQRVDSLHKADSLAKIASAAQKIIDDSLKLDSIADKVKTAHGMLVKIYHLHTIAYAPPHGAGAAEVIVHDVETGDESHVFLPGAEYLGKMSSLKYIGDSTLEVGVHFKDGAATNDYYKIDLSSNSVFEHWNK